MRTNDIIFIKAAKIDNNCTTMVAISNNMVALVESDDDFTFIINNATTRETATLVKIDNITQADEIVRICYNAIDTDTTVTFGFQDGLQVFNQP